MAIYEGSEPMPDRLEDHRSPLMHGIDLSRPPMNGSLAYEPTSPASGKSIPDNNNKSTISFYYLDQDAQAEELVRGPYAGHL